MSTEELLKPRYKVIADWPEMRDRFKGNPIIILNMNDGSDGPYTTNGYYLESFFTDYPHLFKKLEWWEERKPEDLPLFVKDAYIPASSEYHMVYKASYDIAGNTIFLNGCPLTFYGKIHQLLPATREEYLSQNKVL